MDHKRMRFFPALLVCALVWAETGNKVDAQLTAAPIWTTLSEARDNGTALPEDATAALRKYVQAAPPLADPPSQRLKYFLRHLDSPELAIQIDAKRELAVAGPRHLARLEVRDIAHLEEFLRRADKPKKLVPGLDRLIGGYLLNRGTVAIDRVDTWYFRQEGRTVAEIYAAMQAVKFAYTHEHNTIPKSRLKQSMRLLVDHPPLFDLALNSLAQWGDWSMQDRAVQLFGTKDHQSDSARRAIIRYVMLSGRRIPVDQTENIPKDVAQARAHLKSLQQRDPSNYDVILKGKEWLDPPKLIVPKRNDTGAEIAPIATSLSGLPIYTSAIHNLTFNLDGSRLLAGTGDGRIHIWNRHTGAYAAGIKAHSRWCFTIAMHPDGQQLASGGGDHLIKLWSDQKGTLARELKGHENDVHAMAFSPDGKRIYSAGDDYLVRVFDVATGKLLNSMAGHTEAVPTLDISPDGKLIATGSRDDTVRIWDAESGQLLRTIEQHTDDVHGVAFTPDGKLLASASYDEKIHLWNVESGELVRTLDGHQNWVFSLDFDSTGQRLASGDKDGRVILWNVQTGAEIAAMKRQRHVSCVRFSPDDKLLASSSPDTTIHLWDLSDYQVERTLSPPKPKRSK